VVLLWVKAGLEDQLNDKILFDLTSFKKTL
jgi:hypothetical protein